MFGMPDVAFNNAFSQPHQGDQVRGYGFLHDGSTDTIFRFLNATVFNFNANNPPFLGNVGYPSGAAGNGVRRDSEQFILAFDTDLAPIVGQQVTLTSTNSAQVSARIALLIQRANANFTSAILGAGVKECDLIVKGTIDGVDKGWFYETGPGTFRPDDGGANVSDATLQADVSGPDTLTYTCVTPGAGLRAGIERDRDGVLDAIDNCVDVPNNQLDGEGDGAGDACDNCVAKGNADQADTDSDGTGNVCDNLCVGTTTTVTSLVPATRKKGQAFQVVGTGFGPSAEVWIGSVQVAATEDGGALLAQVPTGPALSVGTHPVKVVNPEGCESQEIATLTVQAAGSSCGLTGVEPFLLFGLLGVRRLRLLIG
jgi:hypothetical protein